MANTNKSCKIHPVLKNRSICAKYNGNVCAAKKPRKSCISKSNVKHVPHSLTTNNKHVSDSISSDDKTFGNNVCSNFNNSLIEYIESLGNDNDEYFLEAKNDMLNILNYGSDNICHHYCPDFVDILCSKNYESAEQYIKKINHITDFYKDRIINLQCKKNISYNFITEILRHYTDLNNKYALLRQEYDVLTSCIDHKLSDLQ